MQNLNFKTLSKRPAIALLESRYMSLSRFAVGLGAKAYKALIQRPTQKNQDEKVDKQPDTTPI